MSSASTSFPPLSGGVPTKQQDLAASIIFATAFAILVLPALWRLFAAGSRSLILIRPTIFCIAQAAAYALRAIVANGNSSTTVFEVSEILLLAGFILICEPIPALLTRVIGKDGDTPFPSQSLQLQRKALTILRIALMVALILGIIAATDISSNESESTMQSIKQYRIANASLVIGAMVGSALVAISVTRDSLIGSRTVAWLVTQTLLIMLTAAYKLENTLKPSGSFSLQGKVVFYILNAAVQWFIGAWYFCFNLNNLFVDPAKTYSNSPSGQSFPQSYSMNRPLQRSGGINALPLTSKPTSQV